MKVLVIHGAGMNMRGKVQTEVRGSPALVTAISRVKFPTIEVHISNPARRGTHSDVLAASHGGITGFGIVGCDLALRGLKTLLTK